jgi:hypothetical protein
MREGRYNDAGSEPDFAALMTQKAQMLGMVAPLPLQNTGCVGFGLAHRNQIGHRVGSEFFDIFRSVRGARTRMSASPRKIPQTYWPQHRCSGRLT